MFRPQGCRRGPVGRGLRLPSFSSGRPVVVAIQAAAAKKQEDSTAFLLAAKRLQIVESTIALHRAWSFRSSGMDVAYAAFDKEWGVLVSFANAEPCVDLEWPFIWDIFHELKVAGSPLRFPCRLSTFRFLNPLGALSPLTSLRSSSWALNNRKRQRYSQCIGRTG